VDAGVGCVDEHRFEILDVHVESLGRVAVRPVDRDVLGTVLVELRPLLAGEEPEVEIVEVGEIRLLDLLLGEQGGEGLLAAGDGGRGLAGARDERERRGDEDGEAAVSDDGFLSWTCGRVRTARLLG